VAPYGTIIVEGVYCTRRELAPFYDLRIWVTCPRRLRLRRGIERDGEASRERWELDWMPSEDRYVEQHHPDKMADIVVSGTTS
jgi:uridine kinase